MCFGVINSFLGITVSVLKPATQHLAGDTWGARRRDMHRALLKYYLFLLTFSALATTCQS